MATQAMTLTLVMFLCCLVVADGLLTHEILRRGGRELNPIMRKLFEKIGAVEGLILSRMVLVMFFIAALPTMHVIGWVALNVFYAFVVAHNVKQLMGD
jgi:uncharacterized protein YacL